MKTHKITTHYLTLCLLVTCGLWSAGAPAQPYTFTTLAGKSGVGGADGIGTNAEFLMPIGIALDSTGNLYVADSSHNTIRKIAPGAVVTTVAGKANAFGSTDGVGSQARFHDPHGIAVDLAGTLYVADSDNYTVRKITPDGIVSTVAGLAGVAGSTDGSGTLARFYAPCGIAVDSAGTLYVADEGNHTIRKITPDGVVSTLAGLAGVQGSANGRGSDARFVYPWDVTVDRTGNVYVADYGNSAIRLITLDGVVSTWAGRVGVRGSADGVRTNATFYGPAGVTVDSSGTVYVADTQNNTIRKITPEGMVSTLAGLARSSGKADGTGSNTRFYSPNGVAVDGAGNLYVADWGNNSIRFGQPASIAPPSLHFNLAINRLVLSWPLAACNYLVEASSTLSSDAVWTPLTNTLGSADDSFVLTNTLDAGARFYRLRAL